MLVSTVRSATDSAAAFSGQLVSFSTYPHLFCRRVAWQGLAKATAQSMQHVIKTKTRSVDTNNQSVLQFAVAKLAANLTCYGFSSNRSWSGRVFALSPKCRNAGSLESGKSTLARLVLGVTARLAEQATIADLAPSALPRAQRLPKCRRAGGVQAPAAGTCDSSEAELSRGGVRAGAKSEALAGGIPR